MLFKIEQVIVSKDDDSYNNKEYCQALVQVRARDPVPTDPQVK